MIKLKLLGSFIRLSGILLCNNNFVWFSKNVRKCREFFFWGGICIFVRLDIYYGRCFFYNILLFSN